MHPALRVAAGSAAARLAILLSDTGGLTVEGPLAIVACLVLLARRRPAVATWLFATIASGRLLIEAAKLAIHRPRPPAIDRLEHVASWSFPSSHSAGAALTLAAVALAAGGGRRRIAAALGYSALVGWSRVALGVHWPGDVLAGWGAALAWIGLALAIGSRRGRSAPA